MSNKEYKTILRPSPEVLFTDRRSRFYGYAYPLATESEAAALLEALGRKYRNASHVCYAWRLGPEGQAYRVNDDREPANTAGMPIYGQLMSFEVTNALVAVVRIYGGVKLGKSGLANAYRAAAGMALGASVLAVLEHYSDYTITCAYEDLDKVYQIAGSPEIRIVSQEIQLTCRLHVRVKQGNEARLAEKAGQLRGVSLMPAPG